MAAELAIRSGVITLMVTGALMRVGLHLGGRHDHHFLALDRRRRPALPVPRQRPGEERPGLSAGTVANAPRPSRARRDRFIRPPYREFPSLWTLSRQRDHAAKWCKGIPHAYGCLQSRACRSTVLRRLARAARRLLVDAAEASVREDGDHVARPELRRRAAPRSRARRATNSRPPTRGASALDQLRLGQPLRCRHLPRQVRRGHHGRGRPRRSARAKSSWNTRVRDVYDRGSNTAIRRPVPPPGAERVAGSPSRPWGGARSRRRRLPLAPGRAAPAAA